MYKNFGTKKCRNLQHVLLHANVTDEWYLEIRWIDTRMGFKQSKYGKQATVFF